MRITLFVLCLYPRTPRVPPESELRAPARWAEPAVEVLAAEHADHAVCSVSLSAYSACSAESELRAPARWAEPAVEVLAAEHADHAVCSVSLSAYSACSAAITHLFEVFPI